MFGDGQTNWSVFHLLELAFIEMCKISVSSRQKAQKPPLAELHDLFIYNTIVWGMYVRILIMNMYCVTDLMIYIPACICVSHHRQPFCLLFACIVSLALKVRSQRGLVTRSAVTMWNIHLISRSHQLSMNEVQIDGLKAGVKFGKTIGLPHDMMLNLRQMSDMLIGRESVRKFAYLRYIPTYVNITLCYHSFTKFAMVVTDGDF